MIGMTKEHCAICRDSDLNPDAKVSSWTPFASSRGQDQEHTDCINKQFIFKLTIQKQYLFCIEHNFIKM